MNHMEDWSTSTEVGKAPAVAESSWWDMFGHLAQQKTWLWVLNSLTTQTKDMAMDHSWTVGWFVVAGCHVGINVLAINGQEFSRKSSGLCLVFWGVPIWRITLRRTVLYCSLRRVSAKSVSAPELILILHDGPWGQMFADNSSWPMGGLLMVHDGSWPTSTYHDGSADSWWSMILNTEVEQLLYRFHRHAPFQGELAEWYPQVLIKHQ